MISSTSKYRKSFEELEQAASKFWPSELSEMEAKLSIIPLLLETQEVFISIIGTGAPTLERLFTIVEASSLPANLFLKHLVILADFGDKMLQEISEEAESLFPTGVIYYGRHGQDLRYTLRSLPHQKFSNKALKLDYATLSNDDPLDDLQKDAIALLMYGKGYSDNNSRAAAALLKCKIGDYLGKFEAISRFVRQRYIWLSSLVLSGVGSSHYTGHS